MQLEFEGQTHSIDDERVVENKSYRIIEFIEHIVPQKPQNLFDDK